MATKKAVSKRGSASVAEIQKQLAAEAGAISDKIGNPETNAISTKNKVFTLPDKSIVQGPMDCIIIDFIAKNQFFDKAYDAKNPEPPVCYAINRVIANLTPSDTCPEKQCAGNCDECTMNEFGSKGDGKACNNTRLLAILPIDHDDDTPIMTLSVSATALKGFDGYVAQVAKLYTTPPIGVITTVDFHPEKSYPSLLFSCAGANDTLAECFARRAEAETLLMVEPEPLKLEQKPAKRVTKKKVAKKRAARR